MSHTPFRFGIEHEVFILTNNYGVPSHAAIDSFYAQLKTKRFRLIANNNGHIIAAVRSESAGDIVISNDGFTHVLELAFPPLQDLDCFTDYFNKTYSMVVGCLSSVGLRIVNGSVLQPIELVLVRPKPSDPNGERITLLLQRPVVNNGLFHRDFPAYIASTQVSLSIDQESAIRRLIAFYYFEPLIPALFSNGQKYLNAQAWCVRPLALMGNFPENEPLLGVPIRIPRTLEEYQQAAKATGLRDYSFVSVRTPQRVEFRSACSQNTIEDIMSLIRLRQAIAVASEHCDDKGCNARQRFISACTNGPGEWCRVLLEPLLEVDPNLASLTESLNDRPERLAAIRGLIWMLPGNHCATVRAIVISGVGSNKRNAAPPTPVWMQEFSDI